MKRRTTIKDWPRVFARLKQMADFAHDDERVLFARCAAATPDERMQMNNNCLRLTGCWGWENRRRFLQLRRRLDDTTIRGLWKLRRTDQEMKTWLPDMDLNHDKQIQSLLCYRYTIGQCGTPGEIRDFAPRVKLPRCRSFAPRTSPLEPR